MKQQKNSMDEIDKMLYEYFENNKEIPEETAKVIENTFKKKKTKHTMVFKSVAAVCTVFLLTTGAVFAKDITKFLSEMFNLTSIDLKNDSVVDAIENKEYIQNVDMEYIELNDDYKIKVDYLLVDDINSYMVFNLYSKNNLNEDTRFSILDLLITDDNGNHIYGGRAEGQATKIVSIGGWNNISTTNNEIKELFFLMTNGIPDTENLNIKFTKIGLYDSKNPGINNMEINSKFDYNIELIDKFKNREKIEYIIPNLENSEYKIEKCIATDTGLYLLYRTQNPNLKFELLNVTSNQNSLGRLNCNNFYFITQFHISKEELENKENLEIIDSNNNKIILKKL